MPRGRFEIGLVVLLSLLTIAVWVLGFVSHVQPDESAAEDPTFVPEALSSETPSEDTTPSATPSSAVLHIGETFQAEHSDTTLLQVRQIRPPAGQEPAPGQVWLGIRGKTCMHADTAPSGAIPLSSWVVEDRQGQQYRGVESPWDDYPGQLMSASPISPGACNLGWVLTLLSEETYKRVEKVIFRPTAPEPAQWAVDL